MALIMSMSMGIVAIVAIVGLTHVTRVLVGVVGALRFNDPTLMKQDDRRNKKKDESGAENSSVYVYDDGYAAAVEDATRSDVGSLNSDALEKIFNNR